MRPFRGYLAVTSALACAVLLSGWQASAKESLLYFSAPTGPDMKPLPFAPSADAEVDKLVKQLSRPNGAERGVAAGALGQTGSARAVEPLIGMLKDKVPDVRAIAAISLGQLKDPRAAKPLVEYLMDPDLDNPAYAVMAIMSIGRPAGDAIAEALKSIRPGSDTSTRSLAVYILQRLGDPRAAAYMKGLPKDEREYLQLNLMGFSDAMQASGEDDTGFLYYNLTGPSALAAQEPNPRTLPVPVEPTDPATLDGLISYASRSSLDQFSRVPAIQALSRCQDKRAYATLAKLAGDKDPEIACAAIVSLRNQNDPASTAFLLSTLRSKDNRRMSAAAYALAKRKEKSAVQPMTAMIKCIQNPKQDLRLGGALTAVASALGEIGDPPAIQPLVAAYEATEGGDVVISALSRIKTDAAATALLGLVARHADVDPIVTDALACIGESAVGPSLDALRSAKPAVRLTAARAFAVLKDPRCLQPLIKCLGDGHPKVRAAAATALGTQVDPQALEPLLRSLKDADPEVKVQAMLALGELKDPKARDSVAPYLKDTSKRISTAAAIALGAMSDKRGADKIIKLLNVGSDPSEGLSDLVLPAIRSAGVIQDKRAMAAILASLYIWSAYTGSGQIPKEEDLPGTCIESLRSISGQNYEHAIYRWLAWGIREAGYSMGPTGSE